MATPLPFTFGQATHTGLHRSENQDSYGKFPRSDDGPDGQEQLFIVADGMGGHHGGREASQIAVHTIEEIFYGDRTGTVDERLRRAFGSAHDAIRHQADHDAALRGMGTTCTALVLHGRRGTIAHIGDSRAYLIAESGITQLTRDHTRVESMVQQNILTPEEAATHPDRNVLSRAMGVRDDIDVDVAELRPRPGESYLLCSDGLNYVSDEEIRALATNVSPQIACDRLVQRANDAGGLDNVTVQIVRIERPSVDIIRRRLYRILTWTFALIMIIVLAILILA